MNIKVNYMVISHGRFQYVEIKDYSNVRSIFVFKNKVTIDTHIQFVTLKRENIVELKVYE